MFAYTGVCYICLSCSYFSIFMICSCSNVITVSGLVCLTSTAMSSANVSILLLVVVCMTAAYSVYNIGTKAKGFLAVSLPRCLLFQNIHRLLSLQRFCCLRMIWVSGKFIPGSVFSLFVRDFHGWVHNLLVSVEACRRVSSAMWSSQNNTWSSSLLVSAETCRRVSSALWSSQNSTWRPSVESESNKSS